MRSRSHRGRDGRRCRRGSSGRRIRPGAARRSASRRDGALERFAQALRDLPREKKRSPPGPLRAGKEGNSAGEPGASSWLLRCYCVAADYDFGGVGTAAGRGTVAGGTGAETTGAGVAGAADGAGVTGAASAVTGAGAGPAGMGRGAGAAGTEAAAAAVSPVICDF